MDMERGKKGGGGKGRKEVKFKVLTSDGYSIIETA